MLHEKNTRLFFLTWLKSPLKVGVPIPSSHVLARAMADEVDIGVPGMVVELGGGTGIVTQELLVAGLAPERLVIIERDPNLHRLLVGHFPQVKVIHGDALQLQELLFRERIDGVSAILSSLPLLSMLPAVRESILRQAVAVLAPGGRFIQYTYGPFSPISAAQAHSFGIVERAARMVWRNFPPARIWRYSKRT